MNSSKFSNLLASYLLNLENLKVRLSRKLITEDYFKGARDYNFKWFQDMKDLLKSIEDNIYGKKINDLSKGDKEKYEYLSKNEDSGISYRYEPAYLLKYRNKIIPVYVDDYGQQEFAVYNGVVISGGSYNFFPEEVFAYEVDRQLENEYLDLPLSDKEKEMKFFSELMMESEDKDEEK